MTDYMEALEFKAGFVGDVLIYEPCNYASNMAYYHSVTRACKWDWKLTNGYPREMRRQFANLAFGSHLFHGSHT
jgi:hypothetical protein